MKEFDELDAEFKEQLDLTEDPGIVRLIFGAVCANFYEGSPVWLMLIGPAGVGKTELLSSITGSKKVVSITSMSSKSLLSGFDSKEESSLLPSLNGKIMVISDMSSLTETGNEERGAVYSILRNAYDGYACRAIGGGKRKVEFRGKLGIVCAATPAIESSRKLESLLGERFIFIRPRMSGEDILNNPKIMRNVASKAALRGRLMSAASSFIDNWQSPMGSKMLPRSVVELAKKLAILLCKLRSAVVRDPYNKEISFPVVTNEMPVRVYDQMILLLSAMRYLGAEKKELRKAVCRVAMDSMPMPRFKVLNCIADKDVSVSSIADKIGLSRSYTDRTIEDMVRLGILRKEKATSRQVDIVNEVLFEALEEVKDVKALVDEKPDLEVPVLGGKQPPSSDGDGGAPAGGGVHQVVDALVAPPDLHERSDDSGFDLDEVLAAEQRLHERRYVDDEAVRLESENYATTSGPRGGVAGVRSEANTDDGGGASEPEPPQPDRKTLAAGGD